MSTPTMWRAENALWVIFALALVCLMPTNQSLWIDEGTTAEYARTPTFSAFGEKLINAVDSDSQYPLGNLYFWAGSKILGSSELALRTLSTLWIAVAVLILWRIGIHTAIPYLPALFACNAFVWYYCGEARPYAMQIALGAGLLYSVIMVLRAPENPNRGLNALFVCGPLLCATCMLGAIPFGVVTGIIAVVLLRQGWKPQFPVWIKITISGGLLLLLGCYYTWTLAEGKGAQTVGTWGVGIKNLAFSVYEMLGFVGFGPGRSAMREFALAGGTTEALASIFRPFPVGFVILVLLYVWAALGYLQHLRQGDWPTVRVGLLAGFVIVASAGILFFLSLSVDFPFWGRHLSPVFPFVVYVVAVAIGASTGKRTKLFFALPLLFCLTLLASSLRVRFHHDHLRDDYRSASKLACSAAGNGELVWWAAGTATAAYYGVTFCGEVQSSSTPCVVLVSNAEAANLIAQERPDIVFLSKPDLYDKTGTLRQYFGAHDFVVKKELAAFQVLGPR